MDITQSFTWISI